MSSSVTLDDANLPNKTMFDAERSLSLIPNPLEQVIAMSLGESNLHPVGSILSTEDNCPRLPAELNGNKEKSAMCLVNELARFNNVTHQYQLVNESGPPHQKIFTVLLNLADTEEYRASGPSIKKAQHAAAAMALIDSKLPRQTLKSQLKAQRSSWPMMPTVELNVLAMKRGEPAIYQVYEPRGNILPAPSLYDYRGMHNQRYHVPRGPYCATVSVGTKHFRGRGKTAQSARHSAAEEALKVLRDCPFPESRTSLSLNYNEDDDDDSKSPVSLIYEIANKRNMTVRFEVVSEKGPSHMPSFITKCYVGDKLITDGEGNGKKVSKRNAAAKMLEEIKILPPLEELKLEKVNGYDKKDRIKKPLGRKKRPTDKIKLERNIVTGDGQSLPDDSIATEVLNNVKLDEETKSCVKREIVHSSKSEAISVHPISELIELLQARKEGEPHFSLLSERSLDRTKKEFMMQCSISSKKGNILGLNCSELTSTGSGINKKEAKKKAAEAMLHLLDSASCSVKNSVFSPSLKTLEQADNNVQLETTVHSKERKVKFSEGVIEHMPVPDGETSILSSSRLKISNANKVGRQLAPGLLLMHQAEGNIISDDCIAKSFEADSPEADSKKPSTDALCDNKVVALARLIASELQFTGTSNTAKTLIGINDDGSSLPITRPFSQIQLMATALKSYVELHVVDFPKKSEFLSVVTLTTSPPRICHGLGCEVESARDAAAIVLIESLCNEENRIIGKI